MNGIRKSVGALLCGVSLLAAPAARADLAPPDVSCPTKGEACHNAAPSGAGDGVCTSGVTTTIYGKTSCGPASSAGAGGGGQTECLFCQAGAGGSAAGGSGGTSAAGASAAGTSTAGTTASSGGSSSSGCSVENLGAERGIAVLLLGLGAAALTFARRRK